MKTLIFRIRVRTLNLDTILATIDLTDAICHFIKHIGPAKIVNKKVETWKDFIIFSKNNKHKHFIKYMEKRLKLYGDRLGKDYHLTNKTHVKKLTKKSRKKGKELPF